MNDIERPLLHCQLVDFRPNTTVSLTGTAPSQTGPFRSLARAFATAGTRRRLLGLVTNLPLVGLLTLVDAEETEARRKRHGRRRRGRRVRLP